MGKLLLGAVIVALAWLVYDRQIAGGGAAPASDPVLRIDSLEDAERTDPSANPRFACDGRTRCPQMTSCEEARYFLRHCPGVEMDGDGDGNPCERQWCG